MYIDGGMQLCAGGVGVCRMIDILLRGRGCTTVSVLCAVYCNRLRMVYCCH